MSAEDSEREFSSLQELLLFAWGKRYSPVEWGMLSQAHLRKQQESGIKTFDENLCGEFVVMILF